MKRKRTSSNLGNDVTLILDHDIFDEEDDDEDIIDDVDIFSQEYEDDNDDEFVNEELNYDFDKLTNECKSDDDDDNMMRGEYIHQNFFPSDDEDEENLMKKEEDELMKYNSSEILLKLNEEYQKILEEQIKSIDNRMKRLRTEQYGLMESLGEEFLPNQFCYEPKINSCPFYCENMGYRVLYSYYTIFSMPFFKLPPDSEYLEKICRQLVEYQPKLTEPTGGLLQPTINYMNMFALSKVYSRCRKFDRQFLNMPKYPIGKYQEILDIYRSTPKPLKWKKEEIEELNELIFHQLSRKLKELINLNNENSKNYEKLYLNFLKKNEMEFWDNEYVELIDWEMIVAKLMKDVEINDAKFGWKYLFNPYLQQGPWSRQSTNQLVNNVTNERYRTKEIQLNDSFKYYDPIDYDNGKDLEKLILSSNSIRFKSDVWKDISENVFDNRRSPFQCFKRYMAATAEKFDHRKPTKNELAILNEKTYSREMMSMMVHKFYGRTRTSLSAMWRRHSRRENNRVGRWQFDENFKFYLALLFTSIPRNWNTIGEFLWTKRADKCEKRYKRLGNDNEMVLMKIRNYLYNSPLISSEQLNQLEICERFCSYWKEKFLSIEQQTTFIRPSYEISNLPVTSINNSHHQFIINERETYLFYKTFSLLTHPIRMESIRSTDEKDGEFSYFILFIRLQMFRQHLIVIDELYFLTTLQYRCQAIYLRQFIENIRIYVKYILLDQQVTEEVFVTTSLQNIWFNSDVKQKENYQKFKILFQQLFLEPFHLCQTFNHLSDVNERKKNELIGFLSKNRTIHPEILALQTGLIILPRLKILEKTIEILEPFICQAPIYDKVVQRENVNLHYTYGTVSLIFAAYLKQLLISKQSITFKYNVRNTMKLKRYRKFITNTLLTNSKSTKISKENFFLLKNQLIIINT
ncbi:hypothetical protein SNEBB_004011 [Seison nebaliae]|nr:hypothetical protein SNEBB_004011 [Seison nebaliae]